MPAFIPTHYTTRRMQFYNNEFDNVGRSYAADEAVMSVETRDGRTRVLCGDGAFAGCYPEDLYTGARRT